jgi:hypothetical protein
MASAPPTMRPDDNNRYGRCWNRVVADSGTHASRAAQSGPRLRSPRADKGHWRTRHVRCSEPRSIFQRCGSSSSLPGGPEICEVQTESMNPAIHVSMSDPAGIPALQGAIRYAHGCESQYVATVYVHEKYDGETAWRGDVEVFDLVGHAEASRAYVWSEAKTGKKRRFFVVLHLPPVDSPTKAIHAGVLSRAKRRGVVPVG